jgi:hypothetical protein
VREIEREEERDSGEREREREETKEAGRGAAPLYEQKINKCGDTLPYWGPVSAIRCKPKCGNTISPQASPREYTP